MPKVGTENNPSAKERAKKESASLHRSGTSCTSSGKARILGSRERPSIRAQLYTLLRNKASARVGSLSERREKNLSSLPPVRSSAYGDPEPGGHWAPTSPPFTVSEPASSDERFARGVGQALGPGLLWNRTSLRVGLR